MLLGNPLKLDVHHRLGQSLGLPGRRRLQRHRLRGGRRRERPDQLRRHGGERPGADLCTHRVVHLATHGLVNAEAPTLSSVALAGRDDLTVADLMGLSVDADLVVLSACDTGRGDATLGGDVVGLVRGLLASGARHAVVSLWPVDDLSTCVLMDLFAAELVGGAGVADALAAAQRTLRGMDDDARAAAYVAPSGSAPSREQRRRQRSARDTLAESEPVEVAEDHPYWWAPFIHVGF